MKGKRNNQFLPLKRIPPEILENFCFLNYVYIYLFFIYLLSIFLLIYLFIYIYFLYISLFILFYLIIYIYLLKPFILEAKYMSKVFIIYRFSRYNTWGRHKKEKRYCLFSLSTERSISRLTNKHTKISAHR